MTLDRWVHCDVNVHFVIDLCIRIIFANHGCIIYVSVCNTCAYVINIYDFDKYVCHWRHRVKLLGNYWLGNYWILLLPRVANTFYVFRQAFGLFNNHFWNIILIINTQLAILIMFAVENILGKVLKIYIWPFFLLFNIKLITSARVCMNTECMPPLSWVGVNFLSGAFINSWLIW